MKRLAIVLVFLLVPAVAYSWPATVQRVLDGDTVEVAPHGDTDTPIRVRLYGIDAPESSQEHGTDSTTALSGLLPVGSLVDVLPMGSDKYGRNIGLVYSGRINVNAAMIRDGHAWLYAKFCKAAFCKSWQSAQKDAATGKRGLWKYDHPVAPWQYRKQSRTTPPDVTETGGN